MDWKYAIKACVEACVRDNNVNVVLSPDVDGVVSFYLLRRYLAQTGRTATIIGQYDSRRSTFTTAWTPPSTPFSSTWTSTSPRTALDST